jgi:hypothetical protein
VKHADYVILSRVLTNEAGISIVDTRVTVNGWERFRTSRQLEMVPADIHDVIAVLDEQQTESRAAVATFDKSA